MTLEKQELVSKNNRVCSSCGGSTYKHRTKNYEYWRASKITGEPLCQKCYHKEYHKLNAEKELDYKTKTREHRLEHLRQYYIKNKKRIAERTSEYNKKHPEIKRRYKELHKESIQKYQQEYQRKWYLKNKPEILRRTKERYYEKHGITFEQLQEERRKERERKQLERERIKKIEQRERELKQLERERTRKIKQLERERKQQIRIKQLERKQRERELRRKKKDNKVS